MKELVTESVAANFYAVAWNKLDVGIIKELLDENVEYVLKAKNQSMKGRKDLLLYLQRNMNKIKKAPIDYEIYAEIAETMDDRQCVLLAQGNVDKIKNAVFFTITKGKISKIEVDKYDPEYIVWRSGTYPGTQDELTDNEYIENKPKLVSSYDEEPVNKIPKSDENIEPEVDINEIKEKFLESNPRYRKKGNKNMIVAILLAFFFPGLGLFYISVKQGLYNLIAVSLATFTYIAIFSSSMLSHTAANAGQLATPTFNPVSLLIGAGFLGLITRVGSAIWAYLAVKSINSYL